MNVPNKHIIPLPIFDYENSPMNEVLSKEEYESAYRMTLNMYNEYESIDESIRFGHFLSIRDFTEKPKAFADRYKRMKEIM